MWNVGVTRDYESLDVVECPVIFIVSYDRKRGGRVLIYHEML
jgi:hypothetical protein